MGVLGAALLTLSWTPSKVLDHDQELGAADRRRSRSLVLIFTLITVLLFTSGGIYFHIMVVQKRNEVEQLMLSIAELKTGGIARNVIVFDH